MSKTILLIDADERTERFVTGVLESGGNTVISEPDSDWALRIFEKRFFDLVILGDAAQAGRDAFALAQAIRGTIRGKLTPLLVLQSRRRHTDVRHAARDKLGLVDVLDKPFRPERLLRALRDASGGLPAPVPSPECKQKLVAPAARIESREVERDARAFEGSWEDELDRIPFPEVLARLRRQRANGSLLLRSGKRKKIVSLRDGEPIQVRSNRLQDCLGQLLVRARMISESDCARSLALMEESGRRQGSVLLEMGCISPNTLKRALEKQFLLKLLDVFTWKDGAFKFKPSDQPPAQHVPGESSLVSVLRAGIRKGFSRARIESLLGERLDHYPTPHPDPLLRFQDTQLDPEEEALVERLDGRRSLRQIAAESPDPERVLQLVYALVCTSMFELRAQAAEAIFEEEGTEDAVPDLSGEDEEPLRPTSGLTEVRESLALKIQQLEDQDYFQRLGVERDASHTRITKAFFEMARRYHPDRQGHRESTQVRRLSKQLFHKVCEAHATLSDAQEREKYERCQIGPGAPQAVSGPDESADEARRTLSAELLFRKGQQAMQRREYTRACGLLGEALALCPDEAEYLSEHAYASMRARPDHPETLEQARDQLMRASAISPKLDRPHLYLGHVYRAMDQGMLAIGEFEKAIECNPYCTEALRELRLIKMRHKARRKGKGLFRR
ncbi:MAG: DnaJ domain-containing protein [Deltaproteobacteria bacterium]|nr:DnaJ domain-containing protein [Deltaproteobacteria bacterium]